MFTTIPYGASCTVESYWFTFNQIDFSYRTKVNKVFKWCVWKSQSLNLKLESFDILMLSKPYESIVQVNIIDFLLSFFLLSNSLYTFGLFKKVMIKVSFKHKVIGIQLLKLLNEVLFLHDKFNHLSGNNLPYLFDNSLKCNLRILFAHLLVYFF